MEQIDKRTLYTYLFERMAWAVQEQRGATTGRVVELWHILANGCKDRYAADIAMMNAKSLADMPMTKKTGHYTKRWQDTITATVDVMMHGEEVAA